MGCGNSKSARGEPRVVEVHPINSADQGTKYQPPPNVDEGTTASVGNSSRRASERSHMMLLERPPSPDGLIAEEPSPLVATIGDSFRMFKARVGDYFSERAALKARGQGSASLGDDAVVESEEKKKTRTETVVAWIDAVLSAVNAVEYSDARETPLALDLEMSSSFVADFASSIGSPPEGSLSNSFIGGRVSTTGSMILMITSAKSPLLPPGVSPTHNSGGSASPRSGTGGMVLSQRNLVKLQQALSPEVQPLPQPELSPGNKEVRRKRTSVAEGSVDGWNDDAVPVGELDDAHLALPPVLQRPGSRSTEDQSERDRRMIQEVISGGI